MAALAAAGLVAACGTISSVKGLLLGIDGTGANRHLTGFIGGVAADEPQAAIVGRQILSRGGNAADAATAMGLALAVSLPSRASLGGGGACLGYLPGHGGPVAVMFTPRAPASAAGADRPAAVPMMVRGLYALQDRLGSVRFDELVEPAESMARHGFPISRLLNDDLGVVQGPLFANPAAHALFTAPDGSTLGENDTLVESDLGLTLDQVRTLGAGALVGGPVARNFVEGADAAGGGVTLEDLEQARATVEAPIILKDVTGPGIAGDRKGDRTNGPVSVAFLPLPADGGVAAARAFRLLVADPTATAAAEREAIATASYARSTGAGMGDLLSGSIPSGSLPPLPASTSFVAFDRQGGAVACALTMDNLFGTGRIAGRTGIMIASSPADHPLPLLSAAIAFDRSESAFRAAVASSGQNDAAAATAEAMALALRTGKPIAQPVTSEGRVNAISCPDLLPGSSQSCGGATDPRGSGSALGE
jgi:gamma-glutamyltranspeptidase/glutathione hydrolase